LFLPIVVILFAGSAVGFIERIFLARYSLNALNSSVQAGCVLRFFQLSCIAFANMSQVFISEHLGSNENKKVGKSTWEMLWLSVLSTLLILPLGLIADPIFFQGTEQRGVANNYFQILISGNLLFPIGAVLSSFFLAQGKRWILVWVSLITYSVNLVLDLTLIFGIPMICSPMGALGAAWSTLISKLVFCSILFASFLSRINQDQYSTHEWRVSFSSILKLARVCVPRSLGKAFAILIWTATTYLMITKGGIYLSILSIGSTLTLFCSFLFESLIQSLSVIISRYLGSKEYSKLWKSWRFGLFFALFACGVLALPFLVFPDFILSFFFVELPVGAEGHFLRASIQWVWFWVFFCSVNAPFLAFILAAKDTVYYMIIMSLTWATSVLPIYIGLYLLKWSPDKFWCVLIFDQLIVFALNLWRVHSISKAYRQDTNQTVLVGHPQDEAQNRVV
jgi:MATE family multidrug resistance protein